MLAIDPGTVKCGLAVVDRGVALPLFCRVIPLAHFADEVGMLLERFHPETVVLGSGTASETVTAMLKALSITPRVVDEYGTTLAARARYFMAHPPRGWRRLIPAGLRIPPVPIDDWAAVVMAERFLASSEKNTSNR